MKIGDIGTISTGYWYNDEIVESEKWVRISDIDEDGTIWASDKDGGEFEIDIKDFTPSRGIQ